MCVRVEHVSLVILVSFLWMCDISGKKCTKRPNDVPCECSEYMREDVLISVALSCIHKHIHTLNTHIRIRMYIHTYIHIYVHIYTHMPKSVHTYLLTYAHTYMQQYKKEGPPKIAAFPTPVSPPRSLIQARYAYLPTCLHTYIYTYIHTCSNTK